MNPAVADYLRTHQEQFLEELKTLLRIPSVSADPAFQPAMMQAAEFLRDQFLSLGFTAEIVKTAGHPIVYAEWLKAPGKPTVLIYGHYDVQPPDPLDLWTTPPFEPTIRDGKIYARGATDDKGQFFTHIKAAEAWLKATGSLPVNLKFVIEGEEEVTSTNLDEYLRENQDLLKCDIAVISDSSQFAPGIPSICYGLRGIYKCELVVKGPGSDLHSGMFGGTVMNPAMALARMIAALQDTNGRIQVPHFYDAVAIPAKQEREATAALPFDEAGYFAAIGVAQGFGETGYSTLERKWMRPTCEVNGLTAGYQGVGSKTIVPAMASAKLSFRLVPDQDPEVIAANVESFLRTQLPAGVTMEFSESGGTPGIVFDPKSEALELAKTALQRGFGAPPVLVREGGSIPVVQQFQSHLNVMTLLLGWGLDTDNLHAPDEHFDLQDFQRGMCSSAELMGLFSTT